MAEPTADSDSSGPQTSESSGLQTSESSALETSAAGALETSAAGALETSEAGALETTEAGGLQTTEGGGLQTSEASGLPAIPPESQPPAVPPPPAEPPGPDDELESSRMPFLEHLRELRTRLRNAVIALLVGFLIAFAFSQELFVILARPLVDVWAQVSSHNPSLGQPVLYFNSLTEPFWVYLSVSLWGGIFVASPAIFHQLWLFVAPGLYRNERRYGVAFAAASAVLFIGGAVFCYFLVLPAAYSFFLDYSTHNLAELQRGLGVKYSMADAIALQPLLGMDAYLGFVKKLLLAFGLVFELPLLILFLALAGAVTHRGLWRFNRWFIVLAFAIAALLTPGPDIISQVLMALPMIVLYNASILLAYAVGRRREAAAAAAAAGSGSDSG
jgi:sec-independent protein translocase protein TatC